MAGGPGRLPEARGAQGERPEEAGPGGQGAGGPRARRPQGGGQPGRRREGRQSVEEAVARRPPAAGHLATPTALVSLSTVILMVPG